MSDPPAGGNAAAFDSLSAWLAHLERLHPNAIVLGLERVSKVARALGLALDCPVITVGGTNGKGSTCAYLEAMLYHAGYRVGCYTSPHLVRYNERVRIDSQAADDDMLCSAFARVEAARGDTPLTYFEHGTLAAVLLFAQAGVDAAVLEVGLGGRLDAVNAFDSDSAVVTSVAMDHMDYLGDTREQIGLEKAGIFRAGCKAVCADPDPPQSLLQHAQQVGSDLLLLGRDFGYRSEPLQWQYWGPHGKRAGLPYPALRGDYQLANAAAAITALDALKSRLPVALQNIRAGLAGVALPGRFQVLPGRPVTVLDVAHNPHAARALAANLKAMGKFATTYAVFGMLRDKDIGGVAAAIEPYVDRWLLADIHDRRGASADELRVVLQRAAVSAPLQTFGDPHSAYRYACDRAGENDRIVVCGSFHTVAEVLRHRRA